MFSRRPSPGARAAAAEAGDEQRVDLELLLAVDASSSVSGFEFDLQIQRLAEAFRLPSVVRAIRRSGERGIAVALVQWASNNRPFLSTDWLAVRDAATAAQFAAAVETVNRSIGGNTAIGSVSAVAAARLEDNGFEGRRLVIDISGDPVLVVRRKTATWYDHMEVGT